MKKLIIIIILLSAGFTAAQNDGAGNTGLSFLKLGVGARSIAMGEAFVSLADDGTAYIYNPAMMNATENGNVTAMYNSSMFDMTNNFIGAKFRMKKFGIGIGLLNTTVSDIEVRTIPGAPLEKFNATNFSGGISLSYEAYKGLSLGTTVKMIYEKIYIDEASGFGFDFGASYRINNFSFGAVFANIGSMNELKNSETKLPASVRFGGSYFYKQDEFTVTGAADGFKVLDGGAFHGHIGLEGGYKDFLFLRTGYQTGYDNKGFTAGLGLKYKSLYVDYAFQPYNSGFGSGNSFSLGFNF
ncbi:MAG: PorV/PorQ family protein [Ignavibacteria bacterium]|nr:PorV/PorQ family protein [Ignavibacteria bacterium]